jgi:hypothetical protein
MTAALGITARRPDEDQQSQDCRQGRFHRTSPSGTSARKRGQRPSVLFPIRSADAACKSGLRNRPGYSRV